MSDEATAGDLLLDVEAARGAVAAALPQASLEASPDPALDAKAARFAEALAATDPRNPRAKVHREAVEDAGRALERHADEKLRKLAEALAALAGHGVDASVLADVAGGLAELEPSEPDPGSGFASRVFGAFRGASSPSERHPARVARARAAIDAARQAIGESRAQLDGDTSALVGHRDDLRSLVTALEKQIQLLRLVDRELDARLEHEIPDTDPRHAFVAEELVALLRGRLEALALQLDAGRQAFLAAELLARHHAALDLGLERVLERTAAALRVAEANAAGDRPDPTALAPAVADARAALEAVSRFRQESRPRLDEAIGALEGKLADTAARAGRGAPRPDRDPGVEAPGSA